MSLVQLISFLSITIYHHIFSLGMHNSMLCLHMTSFSGLESEPSLSKPDPLNYLSEIMLVHILSLFVRFHMFTVVLRGEVHEGSAYTLQNRALPVDTAPARVTTFFFL